jgi:cytochrome P450
MTKEFGLDSSQASQAIFSEQTEKTGQFPTHLYSEVFNLLPPGPAQMMLVYHPELIRALHAAKFMERDGFQTLLTSLGELTTQRANHEHQKALRRRTMEYLSASSVRSNIPVISEIAKSHVQNWVMASANGSSAEGMPILEANHSLFIDIVANTMIGRPIKDELKTELSWMFVEGIKIAVLPVKLQKLAAKVAPGSENRQALNRSVAVINAITDVIKEGFKEYVKSGGKKTGLLDDHLEFYLEQEFAHKGDASLDQSLMVWQKLLKDAPTGVVNNLLNSPALNRAFDATTRQALGTISAAFETTASVASWFDIMAATHSDKFAAVQREVAKVADISQMSLHEMALRLPNLYAFSAEVLLHHPPLGIQFRLAMKEGKVQFQGQELTIPQGTLVFPDHQASAAFSGEFNPSRHLEELQAYGQPEHLRGGDQKRLENHLTSHQAFEEGGLHNCAGKFLAIVELMVSGFWKAKLYGQLQLTTPEGIDPLETVLGATNTPHREVGLILS